MFVASDADLTHISLLCEVLMLRMHTRARCVSPQHDWGVLHVERVSSTRLLAQRWRALATVALVLFGARAAVAQQEEAKPQKNCAAVLVRVAVSPDEAYRLVAQSLAGRGYGIQSSDATLRLLTTTYRSVSGSGQVQVVAMVVSDTGGVAVRFTGNWKWTAAEVLQRGLGEEADQIKYGGMGGSPKRKAWNELAAAAASVPSGRVEYLAP